MLKRCKAASSISITVDAEPRREALREVFKLGSKFEHLRQLRITDDGEEYIIPYIYSTCPNLQVQQHSHKIRPQSLHLLNDSKQALCLDSISA